MTFHSISFPYPAALFALPFQLLLFPRFHSLLFSLPLILPLFDLLTTRRLLIHMLVAIWNPLSYHFVHQTKLSLPENFPCRCRHRNVDRFYCKRYDLGSVEKRRGFYSLSVNELQGGRRGTRALSKDCVYASAFTDVWRRRAWASELGLRPGGSPWCTWMFRCERSWCVISKCKSNSSGSWFSPTSAELLCIAGMTQTLGIICICFYY